ncbi:MAG: neutral zinc metallopeptidase [Pseudomonadota bacterium]
MADDREDGSADGPRAWNDLGDNFARRDTEKRSRGRGSGRGKKRLSKDGRKRVWRRRAQLIGGVLVLGLSVVTGLVLSGYDFTAVNRATGLDIGASPDAEPPAVISRTDDRKDVFVTLVYPEPGNPSFDAETEDFVRGVIEDTNTVWTALFEEVGRSYPLPKVEFFSGFRRAACNSANTASGPFYCPANETVYIDRAFFGLMGARDAELARFAQAYVVAHSVAHHVQIQLGILERVRDLRGTITRIEARSLNDRLELQADCLAGLWVGKTALDLPAPGAEGVRAALAAAERVGNGVLTINAERAVVPESFDYSDLDTKQRLFLAGRDSGNPAACETFFSARL